LKLIESTAKGDSYTASIFQHRRCNFNATTNIESEGMPSAAAAAAAISSTFTFLLLLIPHLPSLAAHTGAL
jgi:hypothetical protein